jgi:L-iditol 2-dehydrogenase
MTIQHQPSNLGKILNALVLEEYNQLVYREFPDPAIGPEELLIRVKASGICGSDVHGLDGSTGRRIPPLIMGHEASGIIESIGSDVSEYTVGQRVTFDSTVYCGTCFYCRRGDINLCDDRRVLGVSCQDYRRHGTFAEYVAVPRHIIYPLPNSVSFEQGAMVEPCSVACHAAHITPLELNNLAVVVGAGIIGLLVIQTLRIAGCGPIVAVDLEAQRLALAKRCGADVVLDPAAEDVVATVREMSGGRGADVAFDAVGNNSSLKTALNCLRKGGALTLIGNLKPEVDLALQTVVTGEIRIQGSCASRRDYPACLDMIARGTIDVDSLVSATAPLSEGAQWFERLHQGERGLMKVMLIP